MKEHFAEQLESLRQQLILMAVEAESQIKHAVEALVESDAAKAGRVIERDEVLDQMEVRNEDMTVHLLATQQPVAGDLRFLVAALKINNELERIGDHAVNIAEAAQRTAGQKPFQPTVDLTHMAEIARGMLKQALDAFVRRDYALAREVCRKDDLLDERNRSIIRELLTYMAENPALISRSIEVMYVSKNLERVGDLATNIAEEAFFMARGVQIKHHLHPETEA